MAVYCISDIHGQYDLFMEMLKYIKFTKKDEMYIIGDIFDRGDKVYELYTYVQTHDNIHMIKGNHEQMAEDAIKFKGGDWVLWFHRNKGRDTYDSFLRSFDKYKNKYKTKDTTDSFIDANRERYTQAEIFDFVKDLPLYKEITVNGQDFLLVHAGLFGGVPIEEQDDDLLWIRNMFYNNPTLLENKITIFGHTPTCAIHEEEHTDVWFDTYHKDKIGIDGGCFSQRGGLNCLRLDDLCAFTIKSEDKKKYKYTIDIKKEDK